MVFVLLVFSVATNAQRLAVPMKGELQLSVKDSITNKPLFLVTAVLSKVYKNKGKEIFTYAVSDTLGKIRFNSIPLGDYEISLQYMGYYMKIIPNIKIDLNNIAKGDIVQNFGEVSLKDNITELNAVVVKDHVAPIKYLGDTIQYNAAAYNLSDSDMLEDFFKKLPGWSVDKNGKITANGKVIEQITVNGRIFFLNDPVFVSRNLPAKILKNVKLFEKQSEKSMYTGVDDGERKNTVDVAIKEDMLKGWLGNMSVAAGSKERYNSKGFMANFNRYNQIALIENITNTNEPSIFSSAVQTNSKDTRNYSIGSNLNLSSKNNKFVTDLSYTFKGNDNLTESVVYRQNFVKDSSFNTNTQTKREGYTISNSLNGTITKNDKQSLIIFKPKALFSFSNYSNSTEYNTTGGESGVILNEGKSEDAGKRNSELVSADFQIVKRIGKERHSLSFNGTVDFNRNANEGRNIKYGFSDQKYTIYNNSVSISATLSYTEPIGKKMVFGTDFALFSSFTSLDKKTFNPDNYGNFTIIAPELSVSSRNTEINQKIDLYLQKPKGRGETSFLNFGVTILPSYLKRASVADKIEKWFITIVPKAELRFTSPKLFHFFISYKANSKTPTLSQLIPLPDNTNPLFFKIGNKDLKSDYEHNINMTIRLLSPSSNGIASGLSLNTNFSYFTSRIIDKSSFDENGVQYSMPFNASGDYFANSRLTYQKPFFRGRLMASNNTTLAYYHNTSFINNEKNILKELVLGEEFSLNFNIGDFGLKLGASFNYERLENSVYPGGKNITWRNNIDGILKYSLPQEIELRTDLSYQYFTGYTGSNDKPYLLWNASLSRSIIRNKLIFSISVKDILNQNKSLQRTVTDFYIQETRYNILRQYILVNLTYKFFTGGKSGAFRDRVNRIQNSQERTLMNF